MQFIIHCHRADVETLSFALEGHGALCVTLTDQFDDPILEPTKGSNPLWPHVVITALFDQDDALNHAKQWLNSHYPHLQNVTEPVIEKDWTQACMEDIEPQRFGQRLWVCPTWHTPPADGIAIMLDPGLAFGTGNHATTALCLTWLEQAALEEHTMIDYGCGSGILAIAALKLGAKHVYAIDIDDQALIATKNNAGTNQINEHCLTLGTQDISLPVVDLIVANILLTPLIALKEHFDSLLKPSGQLVVSGILAEQAPMLIDEYQSHFAHQTTEIKGDWALLEFTHIK